MSDFASAQRKYGKKTRDITPSSSVLQPVRDFATQEASPVSEGATSTDWQAEIAQVKRFDHSISHMAIHREGVMQQTSASPSRQTQTTGEVETSEQRKENRTGLPDTLKAGVETLSGYSLDDIRVHYNSPSPAEVDALAYTQGTEIHVGPGQEQHLAHEAWHVVQQKQGRVKPTLQAKGLTINDDELLEREADVMGAKAGNVVAHGVSSELETGSNIVTATAPIQGVWAKVKGTDKKLQLVDLGGKKYILSRTGEVYVEIEYGLEGLIVEKTDEVRAVKPTEKDSSASKRKFEDDEEREEEPKGKQAKVEKEEVKEDDGEEDDEEDKEIVVSQKQFKDVATIFLEAANALNLEDFVETVKATMTDIAIDVKGMLGIIYDLDPRTKDMYTLISLLEKPLLVASCMATSAKILEDTGDNGAVDKVQQRGKSKKSLENFLTQLTQDVANNADKGFVFRVTCKNHSFAVFAQNKQVELMQSFANAEHLGQNLTDTNRKKTFSPEQFTDLMMLMVGDEDKYKEAFEEVFGGFFDASYPDLEFFYEKMAMKSQGDIMTAIMQRMGGNKAKLEEFLGKYEVVKKRIEIQKAQYERLEKKNEAKKKKTKVKSKN